MAAVEKILLLAVFLTVAAGQLPGTKSPLGSGGVKNPTKNVQSPNLGALPKPVEDIIGGVKDATKNVEAPNLGALPKPVEDIITDATQLLTEKFTEFKKNFKKVYETVEEEKKRLEIFTKNHNSILELTKTGNLPYKLKINAYADLDFEEFHKKLNGFRVHRQKSKGLKHTPTKNKKPVNIDWRTKGAVTPARSQGSCGSCYAFASAAALETQFFLKTGVLQYLSPQNILDCTQGPPYDNDGCDGGAADPTFEFVKTHGIDPEPVYPYVGKTLPTCRFVKEKSAGSVSGYVLLDEGDEKGLEEAVGKIGPVVVGIDARSQSFQFYSEGIYYEPKCGSADKDLDHAVLVIGYGTEPNGDKYWLIKNSYGPEWGMDGFMKLTRNVTNACGIATYAVYPIV